MEDDEIKIFGMTEIDTTWFGFDAPTKFNAWEVLNPIVIEVELTAKRKQQLIQNLNYKELSTPYLDEVMKKINYQDYASVSILIHEEKEIIFIKRFVIKDMSYST